MNGIQRIGGTLVLGVLTAWGGVESARFTANKLKQEVKETIDRAADKAIEAGVKVTNDFIGEAVIKTGKAIIDAEAERYEKRLEKEFLRHIEEFKKRQEERLKIKPENPLTPAPKTEPESRHPFTIVA